MVTPSCAPRSASPARSTVPSPRTVLNLFHATGEAAGQTVFHVHLHVVPRWFGDAFRPPLVPERGLDTDLATPAAEIRAALEAIPPG